MFTDTTMSSVSPVDVPMVGLRLSQLASSLTNQFRVPPPEFQIRRFWLDGLGPSWVAVKLKFEGLEAMIGNSDVLVVKLHLLDQVPYWVELRA